MVEEGVEAVVAAGRQAAWEPPGWLDSKVAVGIRLVFALQVSWTKKRIQEGAVEAAGAREGHSEQRGLIPVSFPLPTFPRAILAPYSLK